MADNVLVAVDDSNQSTEALEFACREYPEATITAIHVLDPGDFYAVTGVEGTAMANYDEIQDHHEERAENILETAREQADDHGLEIETDHVVGGVSRSIVDYAAEHDMDHIVIGSHGRTGASRILLGSVAETVARRSPVPVTIVR
ncbi:UspA domain-containing protein [Natrinema pellirubrum DSM 15624]|uniref:Universal stress protein UspA-like protein n=1 Tax=Natrinema pellirubrum (strain DSM 15624 / CIP 106293 / JCM 10476 / NCIMB 786 / 157) TaxID=797303 RepID=L0JHB9_NATP1|nr:universal stress protein [Natrinema pellirubrum]AGB30709.1 universal stress protein UspA-like protein [Natrinema pellirubrum DSM 15624]ELY80367.1 UspA domain-containing protein [Natrinema pellirubrum DSM 15624]